MQLFSIAEFYAGASTVLKVKDCNFELDTPVLETGAVGAENIELVFQLNCNIRYLLNLNNGKVEQE